MSETNETRSGEALQSVVQSQQEGDVASNPSVQSAAQMLRHTVQLNLLQAEKNAHTARGTGGHYEGYNNGRAYTLRSVLEWIDVAFPEIQHEHEANGDAAD